MIKIFKVKDTEIRKVCECNEIGTPVAVKGVFGRVVELLEKDIITSDNVQGNEDKWLLLTNMGQSITEFDSLEAVKDHVKSNL